MPRAEQGLNPRVDDGTLSRSDFTFDAQENAYTCPGVKKPKNTDLASSADTLLYRTTNSDCAGCAMMQRPD